MKEVTKIYMEIKSLIKNLAIDIREKKSTFKTLQREGTDCWKEQIDLKRMRSDFRHIHIARCEMRGRKREQIEMPSEFNLPDEKKIQAIKDEWKVKIDKAIRIDEERLINSSTGSTVRSCDSRVAS